MLRNQQITRSRTCPVLRQSKRCPRLRPWRGVGREVEPVGQIPFPRFATKPRQSVRAIAAACAILIFGMGAAAAEPPASEPLEVRNAAVGDYVHFGQIALTTPDN